MNKAETLTWVSFPFPFIIAKSKCRSGGAPPPASSKARPVHRVPAPFIRSKPFREKSTATASPPVNELRVAFPPLFSPKTTSRKTLMMQLLSPPPLQSLRNCFLPPSGSRSRLFLRTLSCHHSARQHSLFRSVPGQVLPLLFKMERFFPLRFVSYFIVLYSVLEWWYLSWWKCDWLLWYVKILNEVFLGP